MLYTNNTKVFCLLFIPLLFSSCTNFFIAQGNYVLKNGKNDFSTFSFNNDSLTFRYFYGFEHFYRESSGSFHRKKNLIILNSNMYTDSLPISVQGSILKHKGYTFIINVNSNIMDTNLVKYFLVINDTQKFRIKKVDTFICISEEIKHFRLDVNKYLIDGILTADTNRQMKSSTYINTNKNNLFFINFNYPADMTDYETMRNDTLKITSHRRFSRLKNNLDYILYP